MLRAEELMKKLGAALHQSRDDLEVGERAENSFENAEDRLVATVESICGG